MGPKARSKPAGGSSTKTRRARPDDPGHLHQDPATEFLSAHGETAALSIGQAERTTAQLLAEDSILLTEIVDQIVLMPVEPASDRKD